ncbi:MAG: hypothetical protein LBR54_02945 [Oscillospiraceae bacterium]|jgi:hypothetical protein|nr:hypothetical protein [Oscillospiraceae bacterium]
MGAFKDTLKDAALGSLGGIEKAQLILITESSGDINCAVNLKNAGLKTAGDFANKELVSQAGLSAVDAARNVLMNGAVNSPGAVSGIPGIEKTHTLTVQFNPSSIRFEAHSNTMNVKVMQVGMVDGEIPETTKRPASVSMFVDLIFDDVNSKDAFRSEKFNLSPTELARDSITAVKKLKGDVYSVQKQTNGLVGALMRESTRIVSFRWGDLKFTGMLNDIKASYTMFSTSGRPIRSKVSLTLEQHFTLDDPQSRWDAAFTKFFGAANIAGSVSGKSNLQEMQSLLNLSGLGI